jgi:hypothetical protein
MKSKRVWFVTVVMLAGNLAAAGAQAPAGAQGTAPTGGRQAGAQGAAPAGGRQGQAAAARRPPLFFKEEWKQTPAGGEHPVTPESIGNSNLELKLYGPTSKEIQLTGAANDENNPVHVWTGTCTGPCAVAFRDKNNMVDLSGLARIRWNTKMSGFHQIRPIVKLADGTWLIGDRADGSTRDWIVSEFNVADVSWLRLDIAQVVTKGNVVENVDLTKVDEVGFADLMPGSGHGPGGWADVAQVEVYGRPVPRAGAAK